MSHANWIAAQSGLDKTALLQEILQYERGVAKPFYQWVPHRRTYYNAQKKTFTKIVEEIDSSARDTARLYAKYYAIACQHQIPTADLLAALELQQNGEVKKSVVVTRQLEGVQPFADFILSTEPEERKKETLRKLAQLSARIHKAGYYFSLAPQNLFVRSHSQNPLELWLLDLEHFKSARFWARRRIDRNLDRWKRDLLNHTQGRIDYWETFLAEYQKSI